MSRRKRDQEDQEDEKVRSRSRLKYNQRTQEVEVEEDEKKGYPEPQVTYNNDIQRSLVPRASHLKSLIPGDGYVKAVSGAYEREDEKTYSTAEYDEQEGMKRLWRGQKYWHDSQGRLIQLFVHSKSRECAIQVDDGETERVLEMEVEVPESWCGDIWWIHRGDVYTFEKHNGGNTMTWKKNDVEHRDGDLPCYIEKATIQYYDQNHPALSSPRPPPAPIQWRRMQHFQYYDQIYQEYNVPCIMRASGEMHWKFNGLDHRDNDRPSFVQFIIKNGQVMAHQERWQVHGKYHRKDPSQPADVYMYGPRRTIHYYRHGEFHNMRGAAVVCTGITRETSIDYYIHGNLATQKTVHIIRKAANGAICFLRRRYRRSLIQYTRIPEVIIDRIILKFLVVG
jgi:hypothetical protein